MTTPVGAPNYQPLKRYQVGVETVRATKATPTNKWYGLLALMRHQALADNDEYAGTFFQDYNPVRGAVAVDGTYQQILTYEDPHLFRYAIKGAVTGTDDTNTTHGYTYDFTHNPTADDLDTFSCEYGDPEMVWESQGMFFPEFTISADIDDAQAAWKFKDKQLGVSKDLKAGLDDVAATSGTTTTFVKTAWGQTINALTGAWVHFKSGTAGNIGLFRQVISNTATALTFAALPSAVSAADTIDVYPLFTAAISDRTRETIKGPGTVVALDTLGGTPGTTPISGRMISFSVTATRPATYKRFLENTTTTSNHMDLGMVRVSGQLRMEFDRKREWDKYKALTPELIKISQTGTTIDSGAVTTKLASVTVYNAVYDDPTEDTRGNNITVTWPFRGYVDPTLGYPLKVSIKNKQSSLLA